MSLDAVHSSQSTSLADEANHRIANHLMMLAALIRWQGKRLNQIQKALRAEDVQITLEEFAGRLETVGRIHRLLTNKSSGGPVDISEYLGGIADGLVSSLTVNGQTTLHLAFPTDFVLPPEQAATLGLLVGELVTNAIKYAHPAGVSGAVKIEASKRADNMISVEVCDDGVGLPENFDPLQSDTLGFRTIRMLARQLGASLSFENDGLGLSCKLQIPQAAPLLRAVS
jgi:two-component sensor histidine kinase